MTISAALVKELRERTGCGMMDCKRALEETHGDMEKAIELMRKSGQAKADKKAGRVAAEGVVEILCSDDKKIAIMIEVNCETDFVARDENFLRFVSGALQSALQHKTQDVEALLNSPYLDTGATVEQMRQELVAKSGENIRIRRLAYIRTEHLLNTYLHGTRIGVLVELAGGNEDLAKDLAMHIAANQPSVIKPEEVPAEEIQKEKEIFMAQAENSGKPADIIEKMVEGRVRKYLEEVSLLGQPFVKDPNIKVAQLLQNNKATAKQFVRFAVGEGIEKEKTNFAEEVMAQVKG